MPADLRRWQPETRKTTRKMRGSEAYLPAQHQEAGEESRFQAPDVDARRKSDRPGTQAQRSPQAHGLSREPSPGVTWRITDRATFEALRRSGRRARCGPVSVVYLHDDGDRARVGYAVGRRTGGAVERNRLRRRLRAVVRDIETDEGLRPGAYLVAPGPETSGLAYKELIRTLREAMRRAQMAGMRQVGVQHD